MQNFMSTLLLCSITMSVIALIYMLVTPLLAKRYSQKWRYYAWLVIIIGLIIPFRPQFASHIMQVEMPTERLIIFAVNTIPDIESNNYSFTSHPAATDFLWWNAITIIWFIGMIGFIVYHAIKHYYFTRTVRRWSDEITDEQILFLFQHAKDDMGVRKNIKIYSCPCIGSPMLIGFMNPQILLPTVDWNSDELKFILKHEFMHYKRKDILYKYLILTATAIHWFNPIVHIIAKAINLECEASCDADVVQNMDSEARHSYIKTIIGMIKYQSKYRTVLSTNFYGGKKNMKKRISSIMDMSKKKMGVVVPCSLLALTIGTGAVFATPTAEDRDNIAMEYPDSYVYNVHYESNTTGSEYSNGIYVDSIVPDETIDTNQIVEVGDLYTFSTFEANTSIDYIDSFDFELATAELNDIELDIFRREFVVGNYSIEIGMSDQFSFSSIVSLTPFSSEVDFDSIMGIAYEKFFDAKVEEGIKSRAEADEALWSILNSDINATG